MWKSWVMVGAASVLLLFVWGAVMVSFFSNTTQQQELAEEETVFTEDEINDEKTVALQPEIEVVEFVKVDEKKALPEEVNIASKSEKKATYKIDLSRFDFSDVSSKDGVPIDKILTKVGLEE
ncbi:hypothetical protein [Alkalihalobacillus sp. LMS39]|uniref:hypothetical protein n=1 Tax=Alkalihalobacillus sp. LMS39 TaxID=2924032 RepID=UPI001FB54AEF|nr:hypothetical protein [Alkalihalobacillus sp. LMS39]UOE92248.1 hypothetical protein MM271_13365 [Alkalihalobacillus sp. LMS39]